MSSATPDPHRSKIAWRDLFSESAKTISARKANALLVSLAVAFAVGAALATIFISSTVKTQVSERFDSLRATEVRVTAIRERTDGLNPIPEDAGERLEKLAGVRSAGVIEPLGKRRVERATGIHFDPQSIEVPLVSMTRGAVAATRGHIRYLAPSDNQWSEGLVIGDRLAKRADVSGERTTILLDGTVQSVTGILVAPQRYTDLRDAVITGAGSVESPRTNSQSREVLIDVDPGAASMVAKKAALAISPDQPETLRASTAPDPSTFRSTVNNDLAGLVLLIAGIGLGAGILVIAGSMLNRVMERTHEIGLRRSVGASPADIRRHVILEACLLGLIGGAFGSVLGLLATVILSLIQAWIPVINPLALLAGPVIGTAVGVIAGWWPAIKAGRIDPLDALQR